MENCFYRLLDDMSRPGRWFLKNPIDGSGRVHDPRVFTVGEPVEIIQPVSISVRQLGEPMDFTLADLGMPVLRHVVSPRVYDIAGAELQLVPAHVEGYSDQYDILNALTVIDCLDHERSQVTYWGPDDGRLDKIGSPRMVLNLTIDAERCFGKHMFRIDGWKVALIISQTVAGALDGASGIRLEPVSAV